MLKQRIITALILVAIAGGLLFSLSPTVFVLVLIPALLLAVDEWSQMAGVVTVQGRAGMVVAQIALLSGMTYWLGLVGESFVFDNAVQLAAIAGALWAVLFLWIQAYPRSEILWGRKPVLVVLGLALISFTWSSLTYVMHLPEGRWLFVFLVVSVAMADIGGYFFGKAFGKHKLAPVISPGKTWQGFFGGLVMQVIPVSLVLILASSPAALWQLVVLTLLLAVTSVIGDLFESMIKRYRGIKDSGSLLPGHGGVLDRIDGYMAALPVYCLVLASFQPF